MTPNKGLQNIALVGYPKTGNTWFQVMFRVAVLLHYGVLPKYFDNIHNTEIYSEKTDELIEKYEINITHNMPLFNEEKWQDMVIDNTIFKNDKVILIVRHAVPTLVSLYKHNMFRDPMLPEGMTPDDMIYDDIYGIDKYLKFYQSWEKDQDIPISISVVRYESLKVDTFGIFKKALHNIGLYAFDDIINKCINFGSIESMQFIEKHNLSTLPALAPSKTNDPRTMKINTDNSVKLKRETIRYIQKRMDEEMPKIFGY